MHARMGEGCRIARMLIWQFQGSHLRSRRERSTVVDKNSGKVVGANGDSWTQRSVSLDSTRSIKMILFQRNDFVRISLWACKT